MPILSVFYPDEMDDGGGWFLGSCEYTKREEFETRIRALCVANKWQYDRCKWVHHFLNDLVDTHGWGF